MYYTNTVHNITTVASFRLSIFLWCSKYALLVTCQDRQGLIVLIVIMAAGSWSVYRGGSYVLFSSISCNFCELELTHILSGQLRQWNCASKQTVSQWIFSTLYCHLVVICDSKYGIIRFWNHFWKKYQNLFLWRSY